MLFQTVFQKLIYTFLLLCLFPSPAIAAGIWSTAEGNSAGYDTEPNALIRKFMSKGASSFKAGKGRAVTNVRSCPGGKNNPKAMNEYMEALNIINRAGAELQGKNIIKGFGENGLDAVGKIISTHPGGKGLGTAIDLLKTWSEADDATDFATKVVSGKAKGKLGDTAEKAGSNAKKAAENLYDKVADALKDQEDFKTSGTISTSCPGGSASVEAVVSYKTMRVEVTMNGSCLCKDGSKRTFGASMHGRIIPRKKGDSLEFKLEGTKMNVWRKCCKDKEKNYLYMGGFSGKGNKIAIGNLLDQQIGEVLEKQNCKGIDCISLSKTIEILGDEVAKADKKIKDLRDKGADRSEILDVEDASRGDHLNMKAMCSTFKDCCNDKVKFEDLTPGFRKHFSKYCAGIKTGMAIPSTGNTAIPASYIPDFQIRIASDSPQWCSYREGNPETADPGDGDDPRDAPPPDDDGDDPRDAPPPTDDGDDPRDSPTGGGDGDDPRDTPAPSDDGGDDPRDVPGGKDDDDDDPRDAEKKKDDGDDPRDAPVTIYVKAKSSAISTGSTAVATAGQQIKLFADSTIDVALPEKGGSKPQTDHDKEPIQGTTDDKGNLALTVDASAIGAEKGGAGQSYEVSVDTTAQTSLVATSRSSLPAGLNKFVSDSIRVGGQKYTVLTLPSSKEKEVKSQLDSAGIEYETNYCREKQAAANDPLYNGKGAWQQKYDNQWAIKRVGLTNDSKSAWNKLGNSPKPVIVAVIDTGLDWNHLDIDWNNLWRNPKEVPNNGKDDDKNGYIDDVIGWDFYGRHNKPWDHDGHGTIVAGIIAATQNNKVGMAGINPHARIMVLKALNSFGHSRASYLAKAITYAVDNGARIINMSVGGKEITTIEKEAVKYAVSKGVLIIVASGNEGVDVKNYGIAGLDGVLTVGATDLEDKRASFSNWGAAIDIAAPGIDVLSLRARRTDTMRDIPGVDYKNGANYVGKDKRYYRASGTSFAAPIVAGVASLMMSKDPNLSGEEVAQIIRQTADDVDVPGVDQYSGHGIVNANKALEADAGFFINANISGVQVAQGSSGPIVQVMGTADADQFKKASIAIGAGDEPDSWKQVAKVKQVVKDGMLGEIDANELRSSKVWIIRLTVEHENGKSQEFRFRLSLG